MILKFKGQIWKVGNSHVITVPSDYINNDQLKVGVLYEVEMTEKEEGDGDGKGS